MNTNATSVLVAMSGGVDSTATALMLKDQGYVVYGIHFVFYHESDNLQPVFDVFENLAIQTGIPIDVVDVREDFAKTIIQPFIDQYINGITPFPCALCNKTLKWPLLLEYADRLNCRFVGTGHYSQIENWQEQQVISVAADPDKDQSFFLWSIRKEWMPRILFPLGQTTKVKVREYLDKVGFTSMAKKKDSLSVCFAGEGYQQFLEKYVPEGKLNALKGNFVSPEGEVLGPHNGIHLYTVGQRRGFNLNIDGPLFVTEIDPTTKNITLGPHDQLYKSEFFITNFYFIDLEKVMETELDVKIRYRKQLAKGRLYKTDDDQILKVVLSEPEYAIAKGQTAVFMQGNLILGGGFIIN
ncbi:tRNA 2-thiouridine(34) synthase MnmA [Saccharicrinis sp. FJH62]|uniref:tRNA 2-thiouridine(34) synthase MnmA n=1 Tax=Saccharicrinis sp. FJH62 TaxID=3344657 RepID=UPI0035D4B986